MSVPTSAPAMPMAIDRLPPCNPEVEDAVVSTCMAGGEAMMLVRQILSPGDFFRASSAGAVYRVLCDLCDRGREIDSIIVADELRRLEIYDQVGGREYIGRLSSQLWLSNVEEYASVVKRLAVRRRLIEASGRIARLAYDDAGDLEDAVAQSIAAVTNVQAGASRTEISTPADQSIEFLTMVDELGAGKAVGIATGLIDLDRITGGLEAGQLVTLMACTGMGKSAIAQSIGRNVAGKGHPVLYCSVEMTQRQLIRRNAAAILGTDWKEFSRRIAAHESPDSSRCAIEKAAAAIEGMPFFVFYRPAMTCADIRLKALEMRARHGLAIIAVDYLQILTPPRAENRNREVGLMMQALKAISGDLGVPVLVLSQMNRDLKERSNKRPTLTDARDSGTVEQDSDILLGLYRDDYYYLATNEKKQPVVKGLAELILLKHREGAAHVTVPLTWREATCEYVSYTSSIPF